MASDSVSTVWLSDLVVPGVSYELRPDGSFTRRRKAEGVPSPRSGFGQVLAVKGANGRAKTLAGLFGKQGRVFFRLGAQETDLSEAVVVEIRRRPFAVERHVFLRKATGVLFEATYRPLLGDVVRGEDDIFQYMKWLLDAPERRREFIERMNEPGPVGVS